MRGRVDLSKVKENENQYVLLPEGDYFLSIDEVSDGQTKAGDPMVKITFSVVNKEYKGVRLFDYIIFPRLGSLAAGILWRTKLFLKTIDEPHHGVIEFDTDNWLGRRLTASVKHEPYNGKLYAKIASFIPNNSSPSPLD